MKLYGVDIVDRSGETPFVN